MLVAKWSSLVFVGGRVIAACTTTVACPAPPQDTVSNREPSATCEEQITGVQPPPIGDARARYLWRCLLQHQLAAYVWERQACSVDSDCTVVSTQCPFGCGLAVGVAYASEVSAEYERLGTEHDKRASCVYKCNPVVSASCVQKRCTANHVVPERPVR